MKPWREIAIPHNDVLKDTFLQSEFAADIAAVHNGSATTIYQDAKAFFERTYITEGMRQLLIQVMQRLNGQGGEPVIQLQTSFGGGKTHTMLAVYHLATRKCPLSELMGISSVVDRAGLMDVPQARVVVLDGVARGPGQTLKYNRTTVKTLWGELAWQLGGAEGYAQVRDSDEAGTSPGKEILRQLIAAYAPCVLLIDELVAYLRQFPEGQVISGGTFESNISFIQALTEAVKLVPNAVLLASLQESQTEAGGERGTIALQRIEKVFGRVQALWKPIATEEAFEIIRRRLFEPIRNLSERDEVCRAFADSYIQHKERLPSETQESRYYERLIQAYPIHPEVFDRLYEDWSTIEGFQKTRGVLKLMAHIISRLWKDNNQDLMILPSSFPLNDPATRNELVYYLPNGWDAVIERDIDGDRAETTELENSEPRLGQIHAAKRVARTIFLATSPSSHNIHRSKKGIDFARILLGCLQPGQNPAIYQDALGRLGDKLHYLSSNGESSAVNTQFWFDTRPNLRREMEDRKRRFDEKTEVRKKIEEVVKRAFSSVQSFDGVHTFVPHNDVPDDSLLRLVILPLDTTYQKGSSQRVESVIQEYLSKNGSRPRQRQNRLLFIAAEQSIVDRLREATRRLLAWESIVEDVRSGKLNLDQFQLKQAERELNTAKQVLPQVARECFKWLLCPSQEDPHEKMTIEAHPLNTSSGTIPNEVDRVCKENELIIEVWSPIHLRSQLKMYYWKNGKTSVRATDYWEDSLKYLYFPRLRKRGTFDEVLSNGAASRDFFATAQGYTQDKFEGFLFGEGGILINDTLLLIEPEAAKQYVNAIKERTEVVPAERETTSRGDTKSQKDQPTSPSSELRDSAPLREKSPPRSFRGSVEVNAALAKSKLHKIAEEVIELLTSDPNATVRITLEIDAEFPRGASDTIKRAVSENAQNLKFNHHEWE